MELMLAKSLAGHDKDQIYVVIAQEGQMLFLANGTTKTCDHPKKKKWMHVQPILHLPEEIRELAGEAFDDTSIRKIIIAYRKKEN